MLIELRIENFAIIPQLNLTFTEGLVIFTGETGAGKSIILDALEAVLGGRADVSNIRTGSDRALIEATFKLKPEITAPVHALLQAEDLMDNPDFVTLTREIRLEGRNTARVNGRVVTATLQREIGAYLVDIHGQSEHLSLMKVRSHLRLLDRFAAVDSLLESYREVYNRFQKVRKDLRYLRQSEQDVARRVDMLTYQIQEIDAARLSPAEEEELRQERTRLANAENLATFSRNAQMLIEDGTPETPSISEMLGEAVQALQELSRIDPTTAPLFERAESSLANLQDLAMDLGNYTENIEFNPRLLNQVEERIDLINNLKRKYGSSIEDILVFGQQARHELDSITHAEERLEVLEKQALELQNALAEKGLSLSQARQLAAVSLSQSVEMELDDLKMDKARFSVAITTRQDDDGLLLESGQRVAFDGNGFDHVEFLVETNPGEGMKPLVKIASGGETSRLMLALKNVLAAADQVSTLIFDEIDQGIGGRVGIVVGEKLWNLSQQHQVMCITHLAQLAGFGAQHYKVTKALAEGRTITAVVSLTGEARQHELAQMLGPVSEGTLQSADEIMQLVRERTQQV